MKLGKTQDGDELHRGGSGGVFMFGTLVSTRRFVFLVMTYRNDRVLCAFGRRLLKHKLSYGRKWRFSGGRSGVEETMTGLGWVLVFSFQVWK